MKTFEDISFSFCIYVEENTLYCSRLSLDLVLLLSKKSCSLELSWSLQLGKRAVELLSITSL